MKTELFSIGAFHVHGYGLMIAIGVAVGLLLVYLRAKKSGLDPDKAFFMTFFSMLIGFAGGKLFYIFVEWNRFIKDPLSVIGSSGFVVYGGIIIGLGFAYIYCRAKKMSFFRYFDLLIPSLAIGQGFGRIGCFLAGCCYGAEAHNTWGVVFPSGCMAPSGVPLIPTQLYSSIGDFGIAIALIVIEAKTRSDDRAPGMIVALYFIFYSIGRFIIECFRADARGAIGGLSTSQFISFFIFGLGIAIIIIQNYRHKKRKAKA